MSAHRGLSVPSAPQQLAATEQVLYSGGFDKALRILKRLGGKVPASHLSAQAAP